MLEAFLKPQRRVHAHCDLPCGVYDPAQARIEAESVKACQEKYQGVTTTSSRSARSRSRRSAPTS